MSVNLSYLREQGGAGKGGAFKAQWLSDQERQHLDERLGRLDGHAALAKVPCARMAITDFADWDAFVGVDMATKKDLAAVCILFEKEGRFAVFPTFFPARGASH